MRRRDIYITVSYYYSKTLKLDISDLKYLFANPKCTTTANIKYTTIIARNPELDIYTT